MDQTNYSLRSLKFYELDLSGGFIDWLLLSFPTAAFQWTVKK